jgi:hypothetical protein
VFHSFGRTDVIIYVNVAGSVVPFTDKVIFIHSDAVKFQTGAVAFSGSAAQPYITLSFLSSYVRLLIALACNASCSSFSLISASIGAVLDKEVAAILASSSAEALVSGTGWRVISVYIQSEAIYGRLLTKYAITASSNSGDI